MIGKFSISNLPAVLFDGVYRVLACIPETEESKARFPKFGAFNAAPLDPSTWREIDFSWYNPPVLDQGMTSSCVGHCAADGMHMSYLQSGRQLVQFSPFFTYGLINGGRDAGAMISDALMALKQYGICPKDDLPPGVMFQNQFPQKAFDNAKRFKLSQAYQCPNFETICAAISVGFPVSLGIFVGNNFSNVDANGVCPLPSGQGGGGHCILGCGIKKSAQYGWLIKIMNSWGPRFGNKGYAYIHKGHFSRMQPDAFAFQSVIDDPQDSGDNQVPVATN